MSETPRPDGADAPTPAPLRTEPRSFAVHWLVDAAVVFLATIIVALFLGIPWWAVAIIAVVVGSAGARLTHRADVRTMATRRAG